MRVENIVGIVSKLGSEKRVIEKLNSLESFNKKGWKYEEFNTREGFYAISPNNKTYSTSYFFSPSKKGRALTKEERQAIMYLDRVYKYEKIKEIYFEKYFMDTQDIILTDTSAFTFQSKN